MLSILNDGGTAWSGMIVTRRYFGEGKTYIEGTFLRGKDTGTFRSIGSIENSFGLDTYLIRLKGNISLRNNFVISFGTDYSGIFIPKNNGTTTLNILGFDLSLKKTF
jgi:type V secretory pathway adhesin AidA